MYNTPGMPLSNAHFLGFFMPVQYQKLPKTFDEQLDQLIARGLIVNDRAAAVTQLAHINYYRLSGYLHYYLAAPKANHLFSIGTTFEEVLNLYSFDNELRQLLFKGIEKIEISFRTQLIYQMSHAHGTFWVNDATLFSNYPEYLTVLTKISQSVGQSQEQFVRHYRGKYEEHIPPSWISFEILTFHVLSKIYSNLKHTADKQKISDQYGLNNVLLESWIQSLVYIRNLCAHHSRLWNRELAVSPKIPKNPDIKQHFLGVTIQNNGRIYTVLHVMSYLLTQIDPSYNILNEFDQLRNRYSNINFHHMGFN